MYKERKKLNRCPFCGRKPKITDLGQVKVLSCNYSGCKIQPRIIYTLREEKEAIEAWNKRADGMETTAEEGVIND